MIADLQFYWYVLVNFNYKIFNVSPIINLDLYLLISLYDKVQGYQFYVIKSLSIILYKSSVISRNFVELSVGIA